jgi:predicted nucleic acid-binding protein
VAEVLILDAEPLNALAQAARRGTAALRTRAILAIAHELRAPVRVPAPVLAEVCRGGARDAAINRVLAGKGITVIDLTAAIARKAGALLGRAKLDSSHAVDAFVVATAASLGAALIATHDPDDIGRLAAGQPGIRVWAI